MLSKHSNNILYVGGFDLPDNNAAAQRVRVNAKLLKELGFAVSFLGTDHSKIFDKKKIITHYDNSATVFLNTKYPETLIEWIRYLFSIGEIRDLVDKQFSGNIVAIIAYNYPSVALYRLKNYCKNNKISLIADCTEWKNYTEKYLFRIIKTLDTFIRMRFIHRSLDGIIVISNYLYNYYESKSKNVLLLPPLIDKNDIKWRKTNNRIDEKIINLVYAGFPGDGNKDQIDRIIFALNEALTKTKSTLRLHLDIIGITKEQYFSNFGFNSIQNDIEDCISFKGRLPHLETIKIIQNSNFSIFFRDHSLSTKAGFPTKFVESIACGTPVITNSTSNLKDYLIDGKLGFLLDDTTESSLVESLITVIELPKEKTESMKGSCLNFDVFNYQSYKKNFESFIKKA